MDELGYLLAEHRVLVTGTQVWVTDRFQPGGDAKPVAWLDRAASSATVALETTGDVGHGSCTLALGGRGQRDLELSWTPDGRLAALSWKSVGAGAAVLSAVVKVLATVGGVALRAAGLGGVGLAGGEAGGQQTSPDQRARLAWENTNQGLATRREAALAAATAADDRAVVVAKQASAGTSAELRQAVLDLRRLAEVATRARAEVARVDAVYTAWRAGTVSTRQEVWTTALSPGQLLWGLGSPDDADWSGRPEARAVWERLGVAVVVHRLDGERRAAARPTDPARVYWRVPRPVRVDVWRRGEAEGEPATLTSSTVDWFVDDSCDVLSLPLDSRLFGDVALTLTFGALGQPVAATLGRTSGAAAVAGALAAVPDDVATGLTAAATLGTSLDTLRDAGAERRLAGLKRRLEIAQQEVALKAEAATADDVVRLKRLEQRVAIAAAEGTLAAED